MYKREINKYRGQRDSCSPLGAPRLRGRSLTSAGGLFTRRCVVLEDLGGLRRRISTPRPHTGVGSAEKGFALHRSNLKRSLSRKPGLRLNKTRQIEANIYKKEKYIYSSIVKRTSWCPCLRGQACVHDERRKSGGSPWPRRDFSETNRNRRIL